MNYYSFPVFTGAAQTYAVTTAWGLQPRRPAMGQRWDSDIAWGHTQRARDSRADSQVLRWIIQEKPSRKERVIG